MSPRTKYIIASVVLILLSILGLVFLFLGQENKKTEIAVVEPTFAFPSPTPKMMESIIIPTNKPTATPISPSPTPPPNSQVYENEDYKFRLTYANNRRVYEEKEGKGLRITFYSLDGNVAVHAGEEWSWTYPDRIFSDQLLVDGQKSFIFENQEQKIVDFEKDKFKYSIQCVHKNQEKVKEECEAIVKSWQFIAEVE